MYKLDAVHNVDETNPKYLFKKILNIYIFKVWSNIKG